MKNKILDKNTLLNNLYNMNYSERVKTMALLGRDYKEDKDFENLLKQLISKKSICVSEHDKYIEDDNYEDYKGELALVAACASNNIDIILKGLEHDSARIRCKAAYILADIGNAEEIEKVIDSVSCECRRKIIKKISINNRIDVAERLITLIHHKYGDNEAAVLLNACSYETVKKYLNVIGYAVLSWKMISYRNINAVEEYFEEQLKESNENERIYVWNRFFSALEHIVLKNPEFILNCITKYGPTNVIFTLFRDRSGLLLRKNPLKVYEILISEKSRQNLLFRGIPKGILKNEKYLSNEQWINIGTLLKEKTLHLTHVFQALNKSRIKDIFEGVFKYDERIKAIIPFEILYTLPHDIRNKEAERMLNIKEICGNKDTKIRVIACKYTENSRDLFENGVKSSDFETRGLYYKELVRSTSLSRNGMETTVEFLGRLKNDQDLVKREVFQELAKCSPSLFKEVSINDLSILFNSVIDARDSSHATLSYAIEFAYNLMKYSMQCSEIDFLFDYSIDIILRIIEKEPSLRLPLFKYNTPKGLEEKIFDKISPYAINAKKREDYQFIIKVSEAFGRRGNNIVKLQELLKHVVLNGNEYTSKNALNYYLSSKKTRGIRVKELLKIDKSFIVAEPVFEYLHIKHQELLGPFVTWNKIKGKFLTGDTTHLIPANKDFYRWHPDIQIKFIEILKEVANNSKYGVYMRIDAIKSLGQMTIRDSEKIIISLLNNDNMNVSEAAIYALSTIDHPNIGAKYLLNYLIDDRARTAMYSLRKCLKRMKSSDVESMLGELISKDNLKITVKKEIIRLIGEYKFGNTLNILKDSFEKESTHKDIKITIGHAVRNFLDNNEAWDILNMIASSQVPDIALSVLNQSVFMISEKYREEYLKLILKTTYNKDSYVAKMGFISLRNWSSVNEKVIGKTCAESIKNMNNCNTWRNALDTLVAICAGERINDIVLDLIKDLIQKSYECEENYFNRISNSKDDYKLIDEKDKITERDMPARQRLAELLNKILSFEFTTRMKLKDKLFKYIISELSINPLQNCSMVYLAVRVHIASIDWRNEEDIIYQLKNIDQDIKDRPFIITDVCKCITANINNNKGFIQMNVLLGISEKLLKETFELQLIGLVLLEICGSKLNWNKQSVMILNKYRNSIYDEIKYRAFDIWTIKE